MQKKFVKIDNFTDCLSEIFEAYGYVVEKNKTVEKDNQKSSADMYDLYIQKAGQKFIIEVKYSSSGKIGKSILHDAAKKHLLSSIVSNEEIIVVSNTLTHDFDDFKLNAFPEKEIHFLNLIDLFYLVQNNEPLKEHLISILEFSVENEIVLAENEDLVNMKLIKKLNIIPLQAKDTNAEHYKTELRDWNIKKKCGKQYAKKYEQLCESVLKYLFNNELTSWSSQQKSNNNIYIFDMICRIKNNTNSEFWNMLENYFHSKYIIFEFKNYGKPITQKEIYTTEKYLYEKALRKAAIIVSCNGTDTNAALAVKGTLRENGKLILDITNDELVQMIEMKESGSYPSDFLLAKMDKLLMTLEK